MEWMAKHLKLDKITMSNAYEVIIFIITLIDIGLIISLFFVTNGDA